MRNGTGKRAEWNGERVGWHFCGGTVAKWAALRVGLNVNAICFMRIWINAIGGLESFLGR